MTRARRLAVAIGLLAVAGSVRAGSVELPIQSSGAYSVGVQSLKARRDAGTVRQQHDFSCGSAAVATLLTHHYGHAVSEQSVFSAMAALGDAGKIAREGFSLLDMKRYLAEQGFEADGFEASIAELSQAGLPAIALVNEKGYNHFVVVKGVQDERVLIGDPAAGTRAMTLQRFEAVRANGILFVVGNHQAVAQFNRAADWATAPRALTAARAGSESSASATLPRSHAAGF